MGFFDIFKLSDINEGIKEFNNAEKAVLLDVRTAQEYSGGHIPKSKNLPLNEIGRAGRFISDLDTPVFVYCLSGGRSRQAVGALKQMGYTNVKNLGGIRSYKGKVER